MSEIAMLERRLLAERGMRGAGLGELTMPQMHVILATGSFALGALTMHLLHRFKVMK